MWHHKSWNNLAYFADLFAATHMYAARTYFYMNYSVSFPKEYANFEREDIRNCVLSHCAILISFITITLLLLPFTNI